MEVTEPAQGYGKFDETAHELEQAASKNAANSAGQVRKAASSRTALLSAGVRSRPTISMLIACVAGYALGWLVDRR
jgi:hypothetical protein